MPAVKTATDDLQEKIVVHPGDYRIVLHNTNAPAYRASRLLAAAPAAASPIPKADTFGWDTVFAIRLPDVNNALKKPGANPGSFSQDLGDGYTIQGEFDSWQIVMGGDGKNVYLDAPIKTGSLTFNKVTTNIDGAIATVEIALNYLPPPPAVPPPPSPGGSNHNLTTKTTTSNPNTDPVASVNNVRAGAGKPPLSGLTPALIEGALNAWFNAHLQEFDHVFSVVNLNLLADKESFQWLKPSTTSYAYSDGPDDYNSVFGVLCVTDQRSVQELSHQITPSAILAGQRAGFLIDSKLFLKKSVLPGLPLAFQDAKVTDFVLKFDGSEINKADGAVVKLKPVDYNGSTYQPYLDQISVAVQDTEIVTTMKIMINVFPGVDVEIDGTYYYTLDLVTKTDGSQTIGFKQTRKPVVTNTKHVAPGVTITFAILEILGAILGIATGGAGDVVEVIVTAIIVAIIVGVIEGVELLITNVLTDGVANAMPTVNPMIYAATDPIKWPTAQSQFKLTSVSLNGSVQLGGDPNFAN
ncbi:MAG: TULIP family P47-like protein [Saprospiraceae bacterium]|nr:TULIP family P47-like protein [Saprospiraceae bacterium]